MSRDAIGKSFGVVAYPLIALWKALHFMLIVVVWSNLFGTKRSNITQSSDTRSNGMAASSNNKRPCKSQLSLEETDDDLPQEIVKLRTHHKQAYGYIAKALEIDEEGGKLLMSGFQLISV